MKKDYRNSPDQNKLLIDNNLCIFYALPLDCCCIEYFAWYGLSSIEGYQLDYHHTHLANSFFVLFALHGIRFPASIECLQAKQPAFSRLWCEDGVKNRSLLLRVFFWVDSRGCGVFAIFGAALQNNVRYKVLCR